MLGLIISDSHHNIENLAKVLDNYAEKADFLIHCGDVNDKETLDYMVKNFQKDIYLVWGNADIEMTYENWDLVYPKEKKRLHFFTEIGKFKIKDFKVGICHYPGKARKMQMENDYTFYGHSHRPDIQEIDNKNWLVNPGNVAGLYQKASFALWDVEKGLFKLILIEQL